MSFNELETQKIKNVIEAELMAKRRPPMEIRSQVDLNYRLEKQSVIIFETRQHWADSNHQIESEIAKITYVKSRKLWKLF